MSTVIVHIFVRCTVHCCVCTVVLYITRTVVLLLYSVVLYTVQYILYCAIVHSYYAGLVVVKLIMSFQLHAFNFLCAKFWGGLCKILALALGYCMVLFFFKLTRKPYAVLLMFFYVLQNFIENRVF